MNWSRPPRSEDPKDPGDPGWWQASDGLWYPPESSWSPPSAAPAPPKKESNVWVAVVVGALVLVGIVSIVAVLRSGSGSHDDGASTAFPSTTDTSAPTDAPPSGGLSTTTQPPLSSVVASRATVVANPSPGSGVAVDIAEAKRVTARLWNAHVRARLYRDAPLMKAIDDGPVLEADYGYLCYLGCRGSSATASESILNVPKQTAWPASFAATVFYDTGCLVADRPCVDTFIAKQAARGAPWKIVMWTTFSRNRTSPEERPELSPDGQYAVTPGQPPVGANELLTAYTDYLDALKRTGAPPASTILSPGAFTSERAQELYDPPSKQQALGDTAEVRYRVDPADPTYTLATSQGTTTVCGTIRYVATFAGIDGHDLVQPDDFSKLGANVYPGHYASVTQAGLHMVCFGLHPGTSEPVYVLSTYGQDTKVDAKPAP